MRISQLIWVKLFPYFSSKPAHQHIDNVDGEKDQLEVSSKPTRSIWGVERCSRRARITIWREKLESLWYFGWKCWKTAAKRSRKKYIFRSLSAREYFSPILCFAACERVSFRSSVDTCLSNRSVYYFLRDEMKKKKSEREKGKIILLYFHIIINFLSGKQRVKMGKIWILYEFIYLNFF